MRKWLKRLGLVLGVILALALAGYAAARWKFEHAGDARYALSDPPVAAVTDPAGIARGRHLFETRGCADCHGADGGGKLFIDAGPVGQLYAPNLTRGGRDPGADPDRVAAALRHGVAADGRPLLFMPVEDFVLMSDEDVGQIAAWLHAMPPSPKPSVDSRIKPLGHVLYALGKLPLFPAATVDHAPRARPAPAVAPTAAYGRYLAQGCVGCHGTDYAGQHVPGTPPELPDAANLTPAGLKGWTATDFRRALREGKRPDGSAIDPFMPWPAFSKMTDVEIDALWAYLQTVPAKATPAKGG